jgi:hypothetical protein
MKTPEELKAFKNMIHDIVRAGHLKIPGGKAFYELIDEYAELQTENETLKNKRIFKKK